MISEMDRLDRLRKVRDELLAYPKSFARDQAHITFLLATLDERAVELIALEELQREKERQLMDLFVTTVQSMLAGAGPKLQQSDMEYLSQLRDRMSIPTLKRLEKKLALWPKAGVSIRMKKILDLVTARTRQSDPGESQRGRFDDEAGEGIRDELRLQTEDPDFAGNKCLKFISTVGADALFPAQSARVATADKEYRKLSNRNELGELHHDATLSLLASELRIQGLLGPINVLPWSSKRERYEPPPHDLFDRLSSAGDGWYFFLAGLASYHTVMVAVHVTGGSRTYFEIDNHDVVSKDAAEIDEAFDSFGRFQKVPSRVWQVYVQPAT